MRSRKIQRAIKETFPKLSWEDFERYSSEYESRHYRMMTYKNVDGRERLAQNCLNFLLRTLLRSRLLYLDIVTEINESQMIAAFLSTRAHFESTGSIGYFSKYFRAYLKKDSRLEGLDKILRSLSLGGKTFPPKEKEPNRPDTVNVLTQIDAADQIFHEISKGEKIKPFRDIYDFLSEFCHPNWAGLSFGIKLGESGVVEFLEDSNWEEGDLFQIVNGVCISTRFFMFLYDTAFKNMMSTFPFLLTQLQK